MSAEAFDVHDGVVLVTSTELERLKSAERKLASLERERLRTVWDNARLTVIVRRMEKRIASQRRRLARLQNSNESR
jgi:hypothetical protein